MKKDTPKDFESAMEALEQKVKALEEGNLPLAEALKTFEEGMQLAGFCSRQLKAAEGRVEILLRNMDGTMRKEPFPGAGEVPEENGL